VFSGKFGYEATGVSEASLEFQQNRTQPDFNIIHQWSVCD